MTERVDAVVIGMGPGGEYAAGLLAEEGLTTVGIDANLAGGECPYWGCIPSKMMVRAAGLLAEARRVDGIAGKAAVTPDWADVARRIREEATDDWHDTAAVKRFEAKGGRFVRGKARLVSADTVEVNGQRFNATRAIVIGTGSAPARPPIDGLEGTPYWTNHEAIEADTLPASMIVLGGGPIGIELGQAYARFGCKVTVIEGGDRLLSREEPESGALIQRIFEAEGIEVITGAKAERVSHDGDFAVQLSNGAEVRGEKLLVAVGRPVTLTDLGVEHLGVNPAARAIPVDENLRVADKVWALGDVTGKGAFTHISMYQAGIVVPDILGKEHPTAGYHSLPRVTFTDPEVGATGLTEKAAREQFDDVSVGYTDLAASSRGFTHGPGNDGFIKVVADAKANVLVGATSAGPSGGEVLGLLALAVQERVPVDRLRQMIYAYPTFHRAIESALADLNS